MDRYVRQPFSLPRSTQDLITKTLHWRRWHLELEHKDSSFGSHFIETQNLTSERPTAARILRGRNRDERLNSLPFLHKFPKSSSF